MSNLIDTTRRRIIAAAAVLSIVPMTAMSACMGAGPSATATLTASVAEGKSVSISATNGRIDIIKDPTAAGVEVSAEVRCFGDDQAEADSRLKASTLVAKGDADGAVQVSVSIPKRTASGWTGVQSDVTHITVRAADLTRIVANTSNGSISIGAFSGDATLGTSNGGISVSGLGGAVNADTSNGSIDVSGATSVTAETSNGDINVVLGEGATGNVRLDTSNGSVTVDLPAAWQGTVSADTSLGSVNLSGGAVTGKAKSKTMKIGDPAKATMFVETSNGSVTVRPAKR